MTGWRRAAFLLIFGAGGLALLLTLGFWQLQRHTWKTGLISELQAQAAAAPTSILGSETADTHNNRAAAATGRFDADAPQIRFLSSVKGVGPGFRLIAPFILDDGVRILVDRGFAPEAAAPRGGAAPRPPVGRVALKGALRWPRETSAFTPDPNAGDRLWFARDVPSMSAHLKTAPILLVMSEPAAAVGPGVASAVDDWPRPIAAVVDLPNNHLGYALTWFGLAAVWLVMAALLGFRTRGRAA